MRRQSDDCIEALRPEDLDDETWAELLEQVEDAAERRLLGERDRLIAAGIIDTQGRLLPKHGVAVRGEDGGGW